MSNFQQQLAAELNRRTELLPREIEGWNKQSADNNYGMGIHQSQVKAVTKLFDGMLSSQNSLKDALDPLKAAAMSQEDFTRKRLKLEQSLTGTHSIMATFRYIFSQRDATQPYKRILDAADLVAAQCYLPCIKLANKWRGDPDEHYREPPLIYLNAKLSPAAITRRQYFGLIGLELQGGEDINLPISIISLSFHDTAVFWALCSIYHEVGHVLDQDLGLRKDLGAALEAKLGDSKNKALWSKTWLGEVIADVFGMLLGGAGFAGSLIGMLFKTKEEVVGDSGGVHPNSYVRVFLLAALLRGTGVDELKTLAAALESDWKNFYGPAPQWESFVGECTTVADLLLTAPLPSLKGHRLLDFASNGAGAPPPLDLKNDYERAKALATYLRLDTETTEFTEAMSKPESLIRLVPAAAQLAVQNVKADHTQKIADLNNGALDFILELQKLAHIDFLAEPDSAAHDAYVDSLIQKLDFSWLKIETT